MAYAIDTETLVDTATTTVLHSTGRATDATEVDATIFDASASKYALATLTLSAATTASDRWCIGEIISSNDGTAIHMVVQDQVLGGTTMQVYRCTSGTDDTPLGWSGTTLPGTTKTLTGSVSGTHTITTSGTVASAMVARDITVSGLKWVVAGGHSVRYFFTGGTASQDIAMMVGGGVWDSTNHFIPVGMGSAAPAAVTLGDIKAASHGAAASDTMTVQMTVKKVSGYNTPNYEGNGKLGFGQSAISGKGY